MLPGIVTFSTKKDDQGDAGTFQLELALINPYTATRDGGFAPSQPSIDYAAVCFSMDIIALYAVTERTDATGPQLRPPIGPLVDPTTLKYGDLRSILAMGSATCVMIGMVDGAVETIVNMGDTPTTGLSITGKDLSKVFYVNEASVPAVDPATFIMNPVTQNITGAASGTELLLRALDVLCAKIIEGAPQAAEFGYPWRKFVRTDALDPAYRNISDKGNYPAFDFQAGSVWANVQELRNAPTARLFVDEVGRLVFDDQYAAWVNQDPGFTIGLEDIVDFLPSFNDQDITTLLSVYPVGGVAGKLSASTGLGAINASTGFANVQDPSTGAIGAPKALTSAAIQRYGYRYGEFDSNWDITPESAEAKRKVVLFSLNEVFRASLVIRGNSLARVGKRVVVPVITSRPNTTKATWYVQSVEHSWTFGQDWTTSCQLAYPLQPGQQPFS